MNTSTTRLGARQHAAEILASHQDPTDLNATRGCSQERSGTAKQYSPHELNDASRGRRPPRETAPRPQLTLLPGSNAMGGERKLRLGGEKKARTRGRGGHAGAGVSGELKAGVRGEAGVDTDPRASRQPPSSSTMLALNGEAEVGAGFEQYARAGLPRLRLANETIVDEPMGIGQKSHGFVGARAQVDGSVGPSHAQANGEVFAGAKTGGQTELTLGGQRFNINGDLRAGLGLDASAAAGLKRTLDGRTRLQLEGRLGGALGAGGSIGGGVDLDVTPMADAVDSLRHPARNGLKSLGRSAGSVAKTLEHAGEAAAEVIKVVVTVPVHLLKSLFS